MMDYRGQRRAYRRRNHYGQINGIIWPLAIVLFFITHAWILFPLAVFAPVLLAALFGTFDTNQQQQQAYSQPIYQPTEQPMYQPYQSEQPMYQPYAQGYAPQQTVSQPPQIYQESGQSYQYQEQQQQQQYEDPLTMYPQE